MNKIKLLILSLFLPLTLMTATPVLVTAQDCGTDTKSALQCGASNAGGQSGNNAANADTQLSQTVQHIVDVASALIGLIAVIMIIVGGIRMVASAGNPESFKAGRSTVIYALIGLAVVIVAQLITRFVIGLLDSHASGG